MSNTLAKICADKREWVAHCKQRTPLAELTLLAQDKAPPRGFVRALLSAQQNYHFGVIAEVKKASPSKGLIRQNFDPAQLAKAYEQGGASCLSVLTDEKYFQGSDGDFRLARANCRLPMIRKDFMLDPYQIVESRTLGADCILLILAALDDRLARDMQELALSLDMDVLLEVHDKGELFRALEIRRDPRRVVIGVNNRNLKTLEVDVQTSLDLAPALYGHWWVAESGISDAQTLRRLIANGAGAFLIGESLMRQPDVSHALRTLLTEARA